MLDRTTIALPDRRLLINGEWIEQASGQTFATIDPATEQVITQVAEAGLPISMQRSSRRAAASTKGRGD